MGKCSTGIKLVLYSMFRQKKDVIYYFILTLIVAVLGMAVPSSIGIITDKIFVSGSGQSIFAMGISIILTVAATLFINILVNRISVRVQSRSEYYIFSYILKHIMQMYSSDEKEMSRHLIGTFQIFLSGIEIFISSLFSVIIYGLQSVFLILIMAVRDYSPFITLCIYAFIIISFILFIILLLKTNREKVIERERYSDYYNFSKEIIDNMETIKNGCSEEEIFKRLKDLHGEYLPRKIKAENNTQWISVILTALYGIGIWIVFFETSVNYSGSNGKIAVIISMFGLLTGYITMFMSSCFTIASSRNQLKFADEVLEKPVEFYDETGIKPDISGNITLNNINFTYKNSETRVIKELSLEIKEGDYIGIAGPSGCGKSTLIRLLLGFEKPDSGAITFDGSNISECNVQYLRRQFGVVLQDASLINGSIANNIGLSEYPDMEKVEAAAKTAGIYDDIMDMPMKFNTLISGESELVSGGQRQRIVLARALFNNPKILILDEATSAMDNVTQRIVKGNLDKLGITRIVIAHRLSTVKDCDRIIVMDKGEITGSGTYEELIKQDGLFAQMARRNLQ